MIVKLHTHYDSSQFVLVGEFECEECNGHGVSGNPTNSDVLCSQCGGDGYVWELEPIEDESLGFDLSEA